MANNRVCCLQFEKEKIPAIPLQYLPYVYESVTGLKPKRVILYFGFAAAVSLKLIQPGTRNMTEEVFHILEWKHRKFMASCIGG